MGKSYDLIDDGESFAEVIPEFQSGFEFVLVVERTGTSLVRTDVVNVGIRQKLAHILHTLGQRDDVKRRLLWVPGDHGQGLGGGDVKCETHLNFAVNSARERSNKPNQKGSRLCARSHDFQKCRFLARGDNQSACADRRCATASISAVWGNMSNGVIETTEKDCCNSARSRARVGGLQET